MNLQKEKDYEQKLWLFIFNKYNNKYPNKNINFLIKKTKEKYKRVKNIVETKLFQIKNNKKSIKKIYSKKKSSRYKKIKKKRETFKKSTKN